MKFAAVELLRENFEFQTELEPPDWPSVAPTPTDQVSACEAIVIDIDYARQVDAAFMAFNPERCYSVRPAYVGEAIAERHYSGSQSTRMTRAVVACEFDGYYLRRRTIPIPHEEFSLFGFTWKDEATAKEYFNRVAPAAEERLRMGDFLIIRDEQSLLAEAAKCGLDIPCAGSEGLSVAETLEIIGKAASRLQMVVCSAVTLIDRQEPGGKSYAWYRNALLAYGFNLTSPESHQCDDLYWLGDLFYPKKNERR